MRMSLVVEAERAMKTLKEVDDQLRVVGNTEKLKGLSEAFDNIALTLTRAKQFSDQLDKEIGKTMRQASSETETAQKKIAASVETTSKKVSSAIDKNAHDMGELLNIQKELSKSIAMLGQEYKATETTIAPPKFDEAKAKAEIKKLKTFYDDSFKTLTSMSDRYMDNVKPKADGEDDMSGWYNSEKAVKVARDMANAAQKIAQLQKSIGHDNFAKKSLEQLREDLDTMQVIPMKNAKEKLGKVPEGNFFDSDYKKSLAHKLEAELVKQEKAILSAEKEAVVNAAGQSKAEFDKVYKEAQSKLYSIVKEQVSKLLNVESWGIDIDNKKAMTPKEEEFLNRFKNKGYSPSILTQAISEQLEMGQKLRKFTADATDKQKKNAASVASNLRDIATQWAQTLKNDGYFRGANTVLSLAIDDIQNVKTPIGNKDTLLKNLRDKRDALNKEFNEQNKMVAEQAQKKEELKRKLLEAGKKSKTTAKTEETEEKQTETKKTVTDPNTAISRFVEKTIEARTKTLDLSKEFGEVAKAIPVDRARELVNTIESAKKSLVQTLNAMVEATNKATTKAETNKKDEKPKKRTKKTEADSQLKETAKDLEQAKNNWEKVNNAIPAPAIAEAAAHAKTLEAALLAVTTMDYSKITSAMESIKKTSAAMVKAAADNAKSKTEKQQESKTKEKEAKAKTLVQERAELIADMERRFSARPNTATGTKAWQKDIEKLGTLTQKIIDMRIELGQVNAVTGDFKQALALATNPQVIQALMDKAGQFYTSLERVNEQLRIAKANTPMAIESRTNKAFNAADKADEKESAQKSNQMESMWAEHEKRQKQSSSDNAKALSDEVKMYHQATDAAEKKFKATIAGLQDEARLRKAEWTKSQENADAAWDTLDRQKLNQQDKMWKDYEARRTKEKENLNKATEKQIQLYHQLSDIEDKANIKLIDAEQTQSLQNAQKLLKEYIRLRDKLDASLMDNKAMSKSQYTKNTTREQALISELKDKGIDLAQNYNLPYDKYRDSIQRIKDDERAVLEAKKQQTAEAAKHIGEISKIASKLLEIRSIMNMYKGENGDIMSMTGYNSKANQIKSLTDKLYALSGQADLAKSIRESMLRELAGVNRIQNVPQATVEKAVNGTKELKTQISDATSRAEELYRTFQRTGNYVDKIRLKNAVKDLDELQKKEAKMNKELGITEGKLQKIINILKIRTNWMFGGMAAGTLMGLPTELANSYREMEQAMAGVQQVLPLIEGNQREVNAETQRFIGIAQEYARGIEEVVDAGRLWGRGYGKLNNDTEILESINAFNGQSQSILELSEKGKDYVRDAQAMATTNELVRQSAMLATVDNFSMAESVRGLEAVLSAYNMRAKTAAEATLFAGRAVDIITKVSHTGQISAQDLVRGIEATGKAAETAGISLSFLSAMLETGARNTGLTGSEIGQAIKALAVGAHTKKAITQLEKFGISVSKIGDDGVKRLRPLQDVILDIADAIQKGDKNAEQMVMAVAGGRYQYSKLYSILSDREEIMRQWGEAINSNGFADKQLEVQLNTINSKVKQLKASLESLIQTIMNSGGGTAIKTMLDLLNAGIKNFSSHVDTLIKMTGAGLAFVGLLKLGRIIDGFKAKVKDVRELYGALKTLNAVGEGGYRGLAKDAFSEATGKVSDVVLGKRKQNEETQKAIELARREVATSNTVTVAVQKETTAKRNLVSLGATNLTFSRVVRGEKAAEVIARNANVVATNSETAAMIRQAAVTTIATMGLNLLIGAVVAAGSAWLFLSEAEKESNKALEEATGLSQKKVEEQNSEIEALKQEISVRKEQTAYADKAIDLARKLQEETAKYSKATSLTAEEEKKAAKAKDELTLIEKNLSTMMSESAVKRIKEAGWTSEAYQKEKDNYITATNAKEKKLNELSQGLHEYYSKRVELLNGEKLQYEQSMSNFGQWTISQLKGLDILDKAWAMYYQARYNQEADSAKIDDAVMANTRDEMHQALAEGDGDKYDMLKARYDREVARHKEKLERMEGFKTEALGVFEGYVAKVNTDLSDSFGKLMSFENPFGGKDELFPSAEPPGEWEDPPGKGGKGSKGRHTKTSVGFGDIREQVYHNMALDGQVVGTGFDENYIKALAQMVNGEDINNLFGLGESDAMTAGFQMAQKIKEFGANGGIAGVLKAVFGDDSRLEELVNNARWYADNLDWSRAGNQLFGVSNASDVAGAIIADADSHLGEQWRGVDYNFDDNATWESQCSSWVSYQMQKHGITSINSPNGDEIMRQAGSAYKAGEAPLNAGDIINWASHVGIYDGNGGYVARNSEGGVHHGTMEEAQRWFGSVLGRVDFNELAAQNGVSLRGGIPWVNSKAKQTIWNWQFDPKSHSALKEAQTNEILEKKYQLELKEAEVQKQLYGETAGYFQAVHNLEQQRLIGLKSYNEKFRVQFETNQKTFERYINGHEGLQTALKNQGVENFFDLADDTQKELMKRLADSGTELDKSMEKLLQWLISNKFKVQESDIAVKEQEAKVNRLEGSMTDQEREDLSIQRENDRYTLSKGFLEDPTAEKEHYQKLADIYESRLARQEAELAVQRSITAGRLNDLKTDIANYETVVRETEAKIQELQSVANPTETQKANLQRNIDELEKRKKVLADTITVYNNLKANGSNAERTLENECRKTKVELKSVQDQSMKLEQNLTSTISGGLSSMFSGMLLEGNSFKDGWKSLWKSIAQIAIKQLLEVWLFKKVLNLGSWFGGGLSGGGDVGSATGNYSFNASDFSILGSLTGRANGGLIPAFGAGGYTDGLIKGAGTGTSDSILTYLAHRGQFIKTSNGEYIIKKDSVDKLGVPFLDALNQNPDMVEKMKHYADGGSLGTEMVPSMKNTTVTSYNKFSTNKAFSQNQNKRVEELLQRQNELIAGLNRDSGDSGKLIVLNTQADSASVMKAIQKNPRAIQKLLGNQRSHGFRG